MAGLGSGVTLPDDSAVMDRTPSVSPDLLAGVGRDSSWWRRAGRYIFVSVVGAVQISFGFVVGAALTFELLTSAAQSRFFSDYAATLTYHVAAGPSPAIVFPEGGPFDVRRGYADLAYFQRRLEGFGFEVERQARFSPELAALTIWGVTPPFPEPASTGLTIHDATGTTIHGRTDIQRVFENFDSIPPLLANSLLFIENRELLTPFDPRSNPVVEWDRLAKAGLLFVGGAIGLPVPKHGGSTLATQLEKYRHSPNGRTGAPSDKVRQMFAASVRAYRDGPSTLEWRRQIVVDYLNSLPLAAVPGYGELYGVGDGLAAWFGMNLDEVVVALRTPENTPEKVRAYKHALALITAVRAPTKYLVRVRSALMRRVDEYTHLMANAGILDPAFGTAVIAEPLVFLPHAPVVPPPSFVSQKASNAARNYLMQLLNVDSMYDLDRLHLEVDTTFDAAIQNEIAGLFTQLGDPQFVTAQGLKQKHLLRSGDPSKVLYSLLLFERTDGGNALRVQADNLDRPLDLNEGIKMELGSTAKLRTLAHYFEVVAETYYEQIGIDPAVLTARLESESDPITTWVIETVRAEPTLSLDRILQKALERRYSASPGEVFFTGGGRQTFPNFDKEDNHRILTVGDALRKSVNLVFIRLMRDLVRYHQARLPYDAAAVLADPQSPVRQQMLREISEDESRRAVFRAYKRYKGLDLGAAAARLLGRRASSARHQAILFFAWGHGETPAALNAWLQARGHKLPPDEVDRLYRAYGGRHLTLFDYAYLLSRHPVDVWMADTLLHEPNLSREAVYDRSAAARKGASEWLLSPRHRQAQKLRLRIRIERDAFTRMTPYWQRLGFPFQRLVPSYATAIGSSSDRPAALAELMGIIVNDGVRKPIIRLTQLRAAEGTPYETVFAPAPDAGERVMDPVVARVLRTALAQVVEAGTARRVAGAFTAPDGKRLVVGGKTGSGDNRFKTFNRWGGVTSSRAINRTATFVFYIGERYFGVVTAIVPGSDAADYEFTSSLPLAVLKLAAPTINARP